MNLNGIIEFIEPDMRRVEDYLRGQLDAPVQVIAEVFHHTVGAGGKRLRPALCLLSAHATGGVNTNAIALGAHVELIHTVTLIHDDIVDETTLRRGKPTANSKWGNETTVLVGDYMFAKVFVALTRNGHQPWTPLLAETTSRMSTGEILEIQFRRNLDIAEEDYLLLIRYKTAELTAAACKVGAMASGASPTEIAALGDYGMKIGLAFQIADDVLDLVADSALLGKPVGNDLREGKVTLPLIHALSACETRKRSRIAEIAASAELLPSDINNIASFIIEQGGIDYCRGLAQQYVEEAKASLNILTDSPAKKALAELADFVIHRTN